MRKRDRKRSQTVASSRRLRSCVAAKGGHFEQSLCIEQPIESVMLCNQQLLCK